MIRDSRCAIVVGALLGFGAFACGSVQQDVADAAADALNDAARVWCVRLIDQPGDSSVLCPPGLVCGNTGGVPGNLCCDPDSSTCTH